MYEMGELRDMRERGEHLIRVKGGGLGCALIRSSVFERVEFPWFEWIDQAREKMVVADAYECRDAFSSGGEDITFCIQCDAAGIPIHADTRVACGHEFREVFWRSVILTGNQTRYMQSPMNSQFWRSVILTGNQTGRQGKTAANGFWRSVILTGNQTSTSSKSREHAFWRSVILTGNQTRISLYEKTP